MWICCILYVWLFQEVRLSSMRKLHTECDLRTLTKPTNSPYPVLNSPASSITQRRPPSHASSSSHAASTPHRRKAEDKSDVTCSTCQTCFCQKPSDIDKYSRLMFPLSFVAFTILYWASYLNINQHTENQDFVFLDQWPAILTLHLISCFILLVSCELTASALVVGNLLNAEKTSSSFRDNDECWDWQSCLYLRAMMCILGCL